MAEGQGLSELSIIPLQLIYDAKERLSGHVMRTPLIPLNMDVPGKKIYLKLENLQPVHSFKLRGACNALRSVPQELISNGVYTCSAGNFAQGLAYTAMQLGVPCTVIMPDTAPQRKVEAVVKYKADIIKVPYSVWWTALEEQKYEGVAGHFIHPVCERDVMAGNGTIGLETLEDLPDVDVIISPFGGGGCVCGIGSCLKAVKPNTKILACEVATAAPLSAALKAGQPTLLTNHQQSFVDGMGGKTVIPNMWSLIQGVIDDVVVVGLEEICKALKMILEKNCVLAEGAGAATVAAALSCDVPEGNIVCIISGGNIDSHKIISVLQGEVPGV